MTNSAVRTRNLAILLERLLDGGTMTRSGLVEVTGLSKATVARLVTELELAELIETREIDPTEGPGRRSSGLGVPSSAGHVIGFSFGLHSSHVVALDLSGRTVGTQLEQTPAFTSAEQATAWVNALIAGLSESLGGCGSPLRLCIALPGRVRDGAPISVLPEPLAPVSDNALATGLAATLGIEVMLETDADMALTGVTSLGYVEPGEAAVLFTLSTALTVSTRTRFGLVQARTSAFGDFAALPVTVPEEGGAHEGETVPMGSLLSVRGITEYAQSRGITLERTSELWLGEDPAVVRVRHTFTAALESAILVAAITTDPEVAVLTGRLAPLASLVLPELRERLAKRLSDPPTLLVPGADDNGLTTALGAAHTALAIERAQFVDRVREVPIS